MENTAPDTSSLSAKDRLGLTILLNKKVEILPHFDILCGYRYPEAEDVFSLSTKETIEKLEQLREMGYLNRKLYGTMLMCPECGEFRLFMLLKCPSCNSMRLRKGSTLRHYKCGHVDFEDKFVEEGKIVCPKCHETLEKLGVDYRKIGVWYHCLDCGGFSGEPIEKLRCLNCQREYLREDCLLKPIWGYEVNEENVREIMLDIELDTLMSALGDMWNVELFGTILGESGIAHPFTLVVSRRGPLTTKAVVDIEYSSRPVGQDVVMRFFAKTADIKVSGSILVVIPQLEESSRKLSEWYGINILETGKLGNIIIDLKEILNKMLG